MINFNSCSCVILLIKGLPHSSAHVRRFDFWTADPSVNVASFSIVLIKTVKVVVIVFKKIFIICFHGIFYIVV